MEPLSNLQRPMPGRLQVLRTVPWRKDPRDDSVWRYAVGGTYPGRASEQDYARPACGGRSGAHGQRWPARRALRRRQKLLGGGSGQNAAGGGAAVQRAVGKGLDPDAASGDLLGRPFRHAHRSIRRAMDDQLRETAARGRVSDSPRPFRACHAKSYPGIPMAFNFSQCRSLILEGILEGLQASADVIAAIGKVPNLEFPVNGVSLDLVPWHGALGISLRLCTEVEEHVRYCNVEWAYFDLTSNANCPALARAADFVQKAYTSENSNSVAIEMAHLIFLAGAEALLDPQVAQLLVELGINAPTYRDSFPSHVFEYMVLDFDGTVRANYCELILANRVTAKWWPRLS